MKKAAAIYEDALREHKFTVDERSAKELLNQAEVDLGTMRGYSGDSAAVPSVAQEAAVQSLGAEVRFWQLLIESLKKSKAQRGSEAARKDLRRDVRNATSLMLSSVATLQATNVALADTEHGQDQTHEHDIMAMQGA